MATREEGDNAFYVFDKPEGLFSRKVLHAIPAAQNNRKIKSGIEGILDPFATGVIIAATGYCTRYLSYFHQLSKTYVATLKLGQETDTLDKDGRVICEKLIPPISSSLLSEAAAKFTGKSIQRPPVFSNVRVNGVRARVSARKNQDIIMPEREIFIHNLRISQNDESTLQITVESAAGVYIRSLARDIAEFLGTNGYLQTLRRTAIGNFQVDTLPPGEIIVKKRLSANDALYFIQIWETDAATMRALQHGKTFSVPLGDGLYKIIAEDQFGGLATVKNGVVSAERLIPL